MSNKLLNEIDEKRLDDSLTCREIIKELFDFGISQKQIMQLIKLLSLELENRDVMVKICSILKDENKNNIIDMNEKL